MILDQQLFMVDTISLTGRVGAEDYWFLGMERTSSGGIDLAATVPDVRRVVASLVADGSDEQVTGHDNATRVLPVKACAISLKALRRAGRDLDRVIAKQRFRIRIRLDDESITVYNVLAARMGEPAFDLSRQTQAHEQVWMLELTTEPWAVPDAPTTVGWAPGTSTETPLDGCTATTNFSHVAGTGPAILTATTYAGESAVAVDLGAGSTPASTGIAFAGTISGSPLALYVDIASDAASPPYPFDVLMGTVAGGPGSAVGPSSIVNGGTGGVPSGYRRYYFPNPGATPALYVTYGPAWYSTIRKFYMGNWGKGTALPTTGSLLCFDVGGSRPTDGTLTITRTGGSYILDTFIYSDPTMARNGWAPDQPDTWQYAPAGRYIVYGNSQAVTLPATVTVTYTGASGVAQVGSTFLATSPLGPRGFWYPVDFFDLGGPSTGLVGANSWGSSTGTGYAGSLLLFRVADVNGLPADDTALTYVANQGGPSNTVLSLVAPSLDDKRGGLYLGTTAATLVEASGKAVAYKHLRITPGQPSIYIGIAPYTASNVLTNTQIVLSFLERHNGYVSDDL